MSPILPSPIQMTSTQRSSLMTSTQRNSLFSLSLSPSLSLPPISLSLSPYLSLSLPLSLSLSPLSLSPPISLSLSPYLSISLSLSLPLSLYLSLSDHQLGFVSLQLRPHPHLLLILLDSKIIAREDIIGSSNLELLLLSHLSDPWRTEHFADGNWKAFNFSNQILLSTMQLLLDLLR